MNGGRATGLGSYYNRSTFVYIFIQKLSGFFLAAPVAVGIAVAAHRENEHSEERVELIHRTQIIVREEVQDREAPSD